MSEQIQRLTQFQTYCVIAIAFIALLPHHAIDAAHARHVAIFRVIVSVLALLGMLGLQWKKQQLKKISSAP